MNQQAPILAQTSVLDAVLSGLLRQRGPALLGDRRRLLGLLRDHAPTEGRAIRILMAAFDGGAAARLSGGPVSELDIGREAALLVSETGISPDLSRQAVESWAAALAHLGDMPLRPPEPAVPVPPPPRPADPVPIQPLPPPLPPAMAVQPLPVVEALPATPAVPEPPQAPPAVGQAPRARPVTVRPAQVIGAPPATNPPAAPTTAPAQPLAAQPLPVQPLPVQSLAAETSPPPAPPGARPLPVQPLPVQPASVQPLPVRPLPVQPLPHPAQAAQTYHQAPDVRAAPMPQAKGGAVQRWASIVVGVLVIVSGIAKVVGAFSGGHPSYTAPAAPVSAPEQPAAPAAPAVTAEGTAVVSPDGEPVAYPIERIKNDPLTMTFHFGLVSEGTPFTYYAIFVIDKGKTTGSSALILFHDGQKIVSGTIPLQLYKNNSAGIYSAMLLAKVPNSFGAPNPCVFVKFNAVPDRLDPTNDYAVAIYRVDATGACNTKSPYGYATLR